MCEFYCLVVLESRCAEVKNSAVNFKNSAVNFKNLKNQISNVANKLYKFNKNDMVCIFQYAVFLFLFPQI